jgi:hypothetical protein
MKLNVTLIGIVPIWLLAACSYTALHMFSLPGGSGIKPNRDQEVLYSESLKIVMLGDAQYYAHSDNGIRLDGADGGMRPNITLTKRNPFAISIGVYSMTDRFELIPGKVRLELNGQFISPLSVHYMGKERGVCATGFLSHQNRWWRSPVENVTSRHVSFSRGVLREGLYEYDCLTFLFPIEAPHPKESFSLLIGEGRLPIRSEDKLFFSSQLVRYHQSR